MPRTTEKYWKWRCNCGARSHITRTKVGAEFNSRKHERLGPNHQTTVYETQPEQIEGE